ncbi:5'-nucleotidase C-terminal domain-containing protein, partial [bacterium]|nr:5'-nucleotidase C-terminal domain-containing protein [bacterium]
HIEETTVSTIIDGEKTKMSVGGYARLSTKINSIRQSNDNVIFLHAGDAVQGTLYFTKYHGEPEFEWLNWMKCDAMVTGNHEYDKGSEILAEFIDRANFPILAGNVDVTEDKFLARKLLPYTILDVDGREIAIIGMVAQDTAETSNPDETVIFQDVIATTTSLIQELTENDIDKIILLSHIGYDRDIELAQSVDNIDIIVGGHTHTFLGTPDSFIRHVDGPYPTIVTSPSGETVYIVQAGAHARCLGNMKIVFDKHGDVTSCTGTPSILVGETWLQKDHSGKYSAVTGQKYEDINQLIQSTPQIEVVLENPEISARLQSYHDGLVELKSETIGEIKHDILHVRLPGYHHPSTGKIMIHGSELAPIVADAMFWKAEQVGLKPDFAIHNAGGVRMDLQAGEITVGTVYELLPFENTLFMLELSGTSITDCLESLMERILTSDNDGSFPYTSNLRYTANMNNCKGQRLTKIEIRANDGSWVNLELDQTYRIATNQYLASGRDGYTHFKTTDSYRYDTGFVDADIFMDYLQSKETLQTPENCLLTFIPVTSTN